MRLRDPHLHADRVLVAACDVATAEMEAGDEALLPPVAHADKAAVEAAWQEVRTAGGAGVAEGHLAEWSRRAAALWTQELERTVAHEAVSSLADWRQAVLDRAQSALADLGAGDLTGMWATAEVVAATSMYDARDRWGLCSVLAVVCPSGEAAWPTLGEFDVVGRPVRYELESVREGSDLCLWTTRGPDAERFDAYVDPFELPLPHRMAEAYADLAARQAEISQDGHYPPEFTEQFRRIDHDEVELVLQMRAALGSAYRLLLGRGNFRRRSSL